jgi:hypothetical protein
LGVTVVEKLGKKYRARKNCRSSGNLRRRATRWGGWLLSLGVVLWGLMGGSASGADLLERVKNQEIAQVLRLRVGHSKVLRTAFPITRISVADPEIADIILISEK